MNAARQSERALPNPVLLLTTVFISGGAVMVYEFIVVRILARYYGGALDVWASVIAVLLAGLSVGYALGGWLADRYGGVRPVGYALAVAGMVGLATEYIAIAVGEALLEVDVLLPVHPYVGAMATAFIPIVALGTVQPQMVRMWARRSGHIGRAAGWISGLSTLGSILGVMVTVHGLLPYVGLRVSLGLCSFVLVLNAAVLAFSTRPRVAAALLLVLFLPASAQGQVRFEDYSAYHHIIVEDVGGNRLLRFDNAIQSTMSLKSAGLGGFEYTDFFHVPVVIQGPPEKVLFLGLGGGTGPKAFLRDYPKATIDVVEIDPMVERLARDLFHVPRSDRLNITIQDARMYLQRSNTRYDIIVMDAYASGRHGAYLPAHLATQEFFRLAYRRLDRGGCFVFNVASENRNQGAVLNRGIHATLWSVFPEVYAFDARSTMNTVYVAHKAPEAEGTEDEAPARMTVEEMAARAADCVQRGIISLPAMAARVRQRSWIDGEALSKTIYTDDYAPVDMGRRRSLR